MEVVIRIYWLLLLELRPKEALRDRVSVLPKALPYLLSSWPLSRSHSVEEKYCPTVILPGGIPEGGSQVLGPWVPTLGRIARVELRPHAVVDPEDERVVHEGIGFLGGRDEPQRAVLHPVKSFGEALAADVVLPGQAVDVEDEGQIVVVETGEIIDVVVRLALAVLAAMVPVLQDEGARVDVVVQPRRVSAPII